MAQWITGLAMRAQGPEFKSSMTLYSCECGAMGRSQEEPWGLLAAYTLDTHTPHM